MASDHTLGYTGRRGEPFTLSECLECVLNAVPALILIIVASIYASDCPQIPSLTAFMITMGSVLFMLTMIKFWYHLDKFKYKHPIDIPTFDRIVLQFAGFATIIWGATITFGEASELFWAGSTQCTSTVFTVGFVYAVVTITGIAISVITVAMFIACMRNKLILFEDATTSSSNPQSSNVDTTSAPGDWCDMKIQL